MAEITITVKGYKCERCKHEWIPRSKEHPTICQYCKSASGTNHEKSTAQKRINYEFLVFLLIKSTAQKVYILEKKSLIMTWEKLKHTNVEINSAGKILANEQSSEESKERALEILDNWRAAHSYPLHIFQIRLKDRAK